MSILRRLAVARVLPVCILALAASLPVYGHAPSGAIFTTLPDGSSVNANIYPSKLDVYLDGGPGPNAPQDAAGLDDGLYVFQVTDPSGKVLLSTDDGECRVVEVASGVIVSRMDWDGAGTAPSDFSMHGNGNDGCHRKNHHEQGVDIDHGPPAVTVQLMPYDDTPNPGGVYKAWMTPLEDYILGCSELGLAGDAGLSAIDCGYVPGNFHGFIPAHSKTDNFKVKEKGGKPQPKLTVLKYCDTRCNGTMDISEGDVCLSGVLMVVTDSTGIEVCSGETVGGYFNCTLPDVGAYNVTEYPGDGLAICGASVNGTPAGATTSVTIDVTSDKDDVVVSFGNTATNGQITATKYCASDGTPIAGIQMDLSGSTVTGPYSGSALTGADGNATFSGLSAGDYTVTEVVPAGYLPIGATGCNVSLSVDTSLDPTTGEPQCSADSASCTFQNVAVGNVGARTPGFWCVQVRREAGENPGENAACYEHILSAFGSVDAVYNSAYDLWVGMGGDPALYNLDGLNGISGNEAQQILCPQVGDAEHQQCRRQSFSLLMNLAGYLNDSSAACPVIGVTGDQPVVIDGALGTVSDVIDKLLTDGCTAEVHNLIQGINENSTTVLPSCTTP